MAAKKKTTVLARLASWVKRGLLLLALLAAVWFGAPVAFAAWRARAAARGALTVARALTA